MAMGIKEIAYYIFDEFHLSNLTAGVTTFTHGCQA